MPATDHTGMPLNAHDSSWKTRITLTVLPALLPAALAACGAGTAAGSDPRAGSPEPIETPVVVEKKPPAADSLAAYYELPPGTIRLTGVVFSAGDQMAPGHPFRSGTIVAMTQERYDGFRLAARGPWKAALIKGRGFPLPKELLADPHVYRSDLDTAGTYSLTIPPGDYVLCLGNTSEVRTTDTPRDDVWVETVFEATVTDERLQTIIPVFDRSTGELVVHR